MKKYLIAFAAASLVACAGYQAKLATAKEKAKDLKEKIECRAKVIEPYLEYVLDNDLPAILEGADISDILDVTGMAKEECDKIKAEFKACGHIEL